MIGWINGDRLKITPNNLATVPKQVVNVNYSEAKDESEVPTARGQWLGNSGHASNSGTNSQTQLRDSSSSEAVARWCVANPIQIPVVCYGGPTPDGPHLEGMHVALGETAGTTLRIFARNPLAARTQPRLVREAKSRRTALATPGLGTRSSPSSLSSLALHFGLAEIAYQAAFGRALLPIGRPCPTDLLTITPLLPNSIRSISGSPCLGLSIVTMNSPR